MATDKPRFTITLSEDLYEKVNKYQHDKKFSTQTKAIVDLIERGAKSLGLVMDCTRYQSELNKIAPSVSDEAMEVAEAYISADSGIKRSVRKLLDLDKVEEPRRMIQAAARGGGIKQIEEIRLDELPDDNNPIP